MSLWKVSDDGTRDLMTAYYTRLQKGEGRSEALRQVKLAMLHGQLKATASDRNRGTIDTGEKLATKDYRHPYFWAAFIQSGDWRSLDGKDVRAQ
jgi:CHAT domain-containing protein